VRHEPAPQRVQNSLFFLQGKFEVTMIGVPDFPKQRLMTLLNDFDISRQHHPGFPQSELVRELNGHPVKKLVRQE